MTAWAARTVMASLAAIAALATGLSPAPAWAADSGGDLARLAVAARQQNAAPKHPWLTRLRLAGAADDIYLADGTRLMSRPEIVYSYNETTPYDVSRFYRPSAMRANLMLHYAGRRAGEIISVGVDSGYSAAKIHIDPALFIGYTRAFQAAENLTIALGAGGWLGGDISEKPCRDDFDRAYYCPTLTAWSAYRRPRHRLNRRAHLLLAYDF